MGIEQNSQLGVHGCDELCQQEIHVSMQVDIHRLYLLTTFLGPNARKLLNSAVQRVEAIPLRDSKESSVGYIKGRKHRYRTQVRSEIGVCHMYYLHIYCLGILWVACVRVYQGILIPAYTIIYYPLPHLWSLCWKPSITPRFSSCTVDRLAPPERPTQTISNPRH